MSVSSLQQVLHNGGFAITAEITPPVSTDLSGFLQRAAALKGLATAVNVTDGAGAKTHVSSLVAAAAMVRLGVEPILQFTCRDRNRLALQADLMGAVSLGIRNVLMLTGDDPKVGDQPETKAVLDLNGTGLIAMARRMRDSASLPSGVAIAGGLALCIGAADMPIDPPPAWEPKGLRAKLDAGADFVQTQFCMDAGVVRRYAARLLDLGIAQRLPILIGVCPIPSAKSARWMRDKLYGTVIPDSIVDRLEAASDPRAEGIALCVDYMRELAAIPGIAGAHVMAPVNPSVLPELIRQAREAIGLRAQAA